MHTPDEVLKFWFGARPDAETWDRGKSEIWFGGGPELDALITERFGADVEAAGRGELDGWLDTPRGRLAFVILCDQFTRNIHRGTGDAFRLDDRAFAIVSEGIDEGMDRALHPIERVFFYLPLEHREDMDAQRRSVACFAQLAEDVPDSLRETFQGYLNYARMHAEIIEQFGRFPHRNALLDRTPTPEETAYLKGGGHTFGQSADEEE